MPQIHRQTGPFTLFRHCNTPTKVILLIQSYATDGSLLRPGYRRAAMFCGCVHRARDAANKQSRQGIRAECCKPKS